MQLEGERLDWRTNCVPRLLRGRSFTCAIFYWLHPGRYTLRFAGIVGHPPRENGLTVDAGTAVQVDWRHANESWFRRTLLPG